MSFSNDVREEIARSITDRDRQFACLYGILLYSRIFTQEQVVLQSESSGVRTADAHAVPCGVPDRIAARCADDLPRRRPVHGQLYHYRMRHRSAAFCEVYHIRPGKAGDPSFQSGEQQPECFSGRRVFRLRQHDRPQQGISSGIQHAVGTALLRPAKAAGEHRHQRRSAAAGKTCTCCT